MPGAENMTILQHSWTVTPKTAIAIQEELKAHIRFSELPVAISRVAGIDVALNRQAGRMYAGIVVFNLPELTVTEHAFAESELTFPYVPGLLTFREGPVVEKAFAQLRVPPDLIVFDGQGIAHPRRCGLASHLGLRLDIPSIGCAKSRLIGSFEPPADKKGTSTPLFYQGEQIGIVLRTRDGVKPVFISPGHRITMSECRAWILRLCTRYRLPEPTRQAHQYITRVRQQKSKSMGQGYISGGSGS